MTEKKNFRYLFFWLCLFVAFLYVSLVLINEYRFSFHSDGAIKSVLARLAIDEGRFLPREWVYANGDLLFVGPQTFSIILFPWLGLSYLSNAISDWLGYVYLLLMVYGACRVIAPDCRRAAIVATALAAGSLTALNFEFVVGGGAYEMFAALALSLFCLAARPHQLIPWKSNIVTALLAAAAACLVCACNATRGGFTIVIPLLVGWFASMLISPAPRLRDRFIRMGNPVILAIIAGAVIGTVMYKYWLLPSVFNYQAAAEVSIASRSEMWRHLLLLPSAWFNYFLVGGPWYSLTPLLRLLQCFVWAIAIALLLAPLWVVIAARRHDLALITLSWIVLVGFGISIAALVVSSRLFASIQEIRYATYSIYGSICIIVILVDRFADRYVLGAKVLLLAISLIAVSTAAVWRTVQSPDYQGLGGSYDERMALIESLRKHDVGTVLVSYWYSHVLTVLSSGGVDAYPIALGDQLHPFPHHMPRKIFYGAAGNKQAVVLSYDEAKPAAWAAVEAQLGEPVQKFGSGPFEVWVYDRDITKLVLGIGVEADTAISTTQLMVRLSQTNFPSCKSAEPCKFWVEATNMGTHVLATAGRMPLRFGIQSVDSEGRVVDQDLGRVDFPMPIDIESSERISVSLPPLSNPKAVGYRICLMQEFVAWHCDRTLGPSS